MQDRRKIYLKRNTTMSIIYELLTIICGFILPKFILQSFGSETNGLVSSVTHFLGFISLCELGMGAVVPASLYKPLADKDNAGISKVVISAQRFYRIIGLILSAYIVILVIFYPLLVADSFDFIFAASLIVILSLSTFAQYFFGITYSLLIKADQKQYITLFINSITLVLNTVVSVVLIKFGFGIHVVKFVSALIFIARPVFLNIYVKKHYKLDLKIKYDNEPIKQKWNGMAQHFASTIQEKADTVILTGLSTLTNVSVYSVYFMVINGMRGLVYSLTAGVSALIGNMYAKGEIDELKRTFSKFEWIMHTVSTLMFTITGILAVPFVQVYTSGLKDTDIYIAPAFSAILCFALAARCIQMPYNVMVQAAGHFKETQNSAIIEPVINVVISCVMVYRYGLIGVAIGTLVSMVYRVFYLAIYLMKNILYIKSVDFIKQLFVDLISVFVMVTATKWIGLIAISYTKWIIMAVEVSLICMMCVILVNALFYPKYLLSQSERLRSKINRK
jgi:hypothetical protein